MIDVQLLQCITDPERRRWIGFAACFLRLRRESSGSNLSAPFRPQLPGRNRIKVCSELCLRFVVLRTAEDGDEGLLGQFFRSGGVVQAPPEKTVDGISIAAEEFFKG